jgi:hypothetical protein
VISATENSNKFPKKPGFGRKNQLRRWVTLGPTAQATSCRFEEKQKF